MNLYTKASIEVGLGRQTVPIPSLSDAEELVERADAGDFEAFVELFRVYRHAGHPAHVQARAAMTAIIEGMQRVRNYYANTEIKEGGAAEA